MFYLVSVLIILGAASNCSAVERPNIVLVVCDDMGFSDLGCYGGEIDTPHFDGLAEQGMRFTQFYNNAKCATTRASIITGLYPRRRGGETDRDLLRPNMATLGEALGAAGYHTALIGKWHLGQSELTHPRRRGFDEFYGLLGGACNFFDPSQVDPLYKGSQVRYFADNDRRIDRFPEGFYTTDAFTDRAIAWIDRVTSDDRPFFLHLCYTAPHYPLHAWPRDIVKYRGRYLAGWEELRRKRHARQQEMGLFGQEIALSGADSQAYDWDDADQDFEDLRMAVYAAMVDRMDQNVGRLIDKLQDREVFENTLFVFFSDNGGCAEEPGGRDSEQRLPGPRDDYVAVGPAWGWAQNTPFRRYKTWMHEGGICTPMIAHWRGHIQPGVLCHQVGHIVDLMPTLLELTDAELPTQLNGQPTLPLDGSSLACVLRGGIRTPPEELAWDYNGNAAIRQGEWKAVWDRLSEEWELFNLAADRTETNDLSAKHPERLQRMVVAYNAWAARTENSPRPIPAETRH